MDNISLVIGQDTIQPTESARSLGCYLDNELKGGAHISKLIGKVREHNIYKTACLMFQSYTNQAPEYLSSLVTKPHSRQIRSVEHNKLQLSHASTAQCQNCSLVVQGPHIWNDLPFRLRFETNLSTFKKNLKTYLFSISYDAESS